MQRAEATFNSIYDKKTNKKKQLFLKTKQNRTSKTRYPILILAYTVYIMLGEPFAS